MYGLTSATSPTKYCWFVVVVMAACSHRPRCHKTKSRRCIKPNPWMSYVSHHGGKGLSRVELMAGYRLWKRETFRRFTSKKHVARRQSVLCDIFAPNSKPARVSRTAVAPRKRPSSVAKVTRTAVVPRKRPSSATHHLN